MGLSKYYDHKALNKKWYEFWLENCFFTSNNSESKEVYSIVIPPPNITGVLHMGHCLNNTIQDILIRWAKLNGKDVCWVPGTDHASIATEAKVVNYLKEQNIDKKNISRDEFLNYAWQWKEKYGNIILEQLKQLGCALDWTKTEFTLNKDYSDSVIKIFVRLFNEGLIYKDYRIIHWDVKAQTALSDEEVFYKESSSFLYFIKYKLVGAEQEYITIATTRPETILGDVAICVHPTDPRYIDWHNKKVLIPIINKEIPIITDEYVDQNFGSGALKITPAHDINDFKIGINHSLPLINILNEDGTINKNGQPFEGLERFEARKQIVSELKNLNALAKIDSYHHTIGYSERTNVVVEPRLSFQWFVKMSPLVKEAIDCVKNQEIKFYPEKFINLYLHWLNNIKDWCISRQLWWGHRIPAWYDEENNVYVAENVSELLKKYPELQSKKLKQDDDVLDTWFSSWLWPLQVFKGISEPNNLFVKKYFPTTTLVTAPEIIFFWVARMIIISQKLNSQIPFKNVYFTGIVRDKLGRKMSKSLGNSPDLLQFIEDYGADVVRFGILISSPAGNDLLFDENYNIQGKEFVNKLWNVLKLFELWYIKIDEKEQPTATQEFCTNWIENIILKLWQDLQINYQNFKLSENLKLIYSTIWNDFCSHYLEWIKVQAKQNISLKIWQQAKEIFASFLVLLHPYMPFITEEIYYQLDLLEGKYELKKNKNSILQSNYLNKFYQSSYSNKILIQGEILKNIIINIRAIRTERKIKNSQVLVLIIVNHKELQFLKGLNDLITKQLFLEKIEFIDHLNDLDKLSLKNIIFNINKYTFSLGGIDEQNDSSDLDKLKAELAYQKQFLNSIEKKLNNSNFISKAKIEIIDLEKRKKQDTINRINTLTEIIQKYI